jgi:hypothetical protein
VQPEPTTLSLPPDPVKANSALDTPWPPVFAPQTDAPWGTLLHPKWIQSGRLRASAVRFLLNFLDQHPLLQGFLLEFRSLVHRMKLRRKTPLDADSLVFGPYFEKSLDGYSGVCRRTLACMRDTERFVTNRPWVTTIDAQMFVDAWEQGAGWMRETRDNPCT